MRSDEAFLQDVYLGRLTAPLHALQARCRFSNEEAAALCGVSVETYRRWLRNRRPNPAAMKLMAILAGYMPWPNWSGWEMHQGLLFPPGYSRHGISPGEILALPFLHQLVAAYKTDLRELQEENRQLKQLRTSMNEDQYDEQCMV